MGSWQIQQFCHHHDLLNIAGDLPSNVRDLSIDLRWSSINCKKREPSWVWLRWSYDWESSIKHCIPSPWSSRVSVGWWVKWHLKQRRSQNIWTVPETYGEWSVICCLVGSASVNDQQYQPVVQWCITDSVDLSIWSISFVLTTLPKAGPWVCQLKGVAKMQVISTPLGRARLP